MGPTPTPPAPGVERFVLHQILDRQHQNVVAAVFEHPAGWRTGSALIWNFQHTSHPVIMGGRTVAPSGVDWFEFLPAEVFCWLQPNIGFSQPGENVLGQICMPPMPAAEAMKRWIIPKFRGTCQNLQLITVAPEPQIARGVVAAQGSPPAEGVRAVIEYMENGLRLEEAIVGLKETQNVPFTGPQGMTIQINWGFLKLYAFRAAKGDLSAHEARFARIAASIRLNPLWENLRAQVQQRLQAEFDQFIAAGYSQIQAAAQLSRQLSAMNDAWIARFEQQRQAAASHSAPAPPGRSAADKWDDYIRGVDTVDDPYWGTSQHDYTYQYHWTDGLGSTKHSNDPFFNPNIGGSSNWTLMERTK